MNIFTKFLIVNIFIFNMNAQKKSIVNTTEIHKKYVFIDTIKTYERVAEKGYKSAEMFKKIGDSYFLKSQLDKAVRWYCELFAMNQKIETEYYFRYAESLISIGKKDEAEILMGKIENQTKITKDKI